jgi:hypothetical protein
MSSIKHILNEYYSKTKEINEINKDIMGYRETFKKRLKQLRTDIENLTVLIEEYLDHHNHPGLTFNGITIKKKQVKRVSKRKDRKAKESDLEILKHQYNLSDACYADIYNKIIGEQQEKNKLVLK